MLQLQVRFSSVSPLINDYHARFGGLWAKKYSKSWKRAIMLSLCVAAWMSSGADAGGEEGEVRRRPEVSMPMLECLDGRCDSRSCGHSWVSRRDAAHLPRSCRRIKGRNRCAQALRQGLCIQDTLLLLLPSLRHPVRQSGYARVLAAPLSRAVDIWGWVPYHRTLLHEPV